MKLAKHIQAIQPSYIREILSAATNDGIISLAGGLPASELFPLTMLKQAMESLAYTPEVYQYGETRGYAPLLDYLESSYQVPPQHIALICNGSQQGLDLIARTYLDPGNSIAVESPCYIGAIQVFTIAQAKIETVQQRTDGPDLDELEALFATGRVKLFYCVPDFHNPTGICWSLDARLKVAQLCNNYQVVLIEDAPYRELRFSGDVLPLVSTLCPERAITLRSYSKTVVPGIRLGVVTGLKSWINPMIKVKQAADLHTSQPMQAVLLTLLKRTDFLQHLERVRTQYCERYQTLSTALTTHLREVTHFQSVEGGMFIWLYLNTGDPMRIAQQAIKKGVAVVPSNVFYDEQCNVPQSSALRLNFSHAPPALLIEAVSRLSHVICDFTQRSA